MSSTVITHTYARLLVAVTSVCSGLLAACVDAPTGAVPTDATSPPAFSVGDSTVIGDTIYWVDGVAEWTDDEDVHWRVEAAIVSDTIRAISVYRDEQYIGEIAGRYANGVHTGYTITDGDTGADVTTDLSGDHETSWFSEEYEEWWECTEDPEGPPCPIVPGFVETDDCRTEKIAMVSSTASLLAGIGGLVIINNPLTLGPWTPFLNKAVGTGTVVAAFATAGSYGALLACLQLQE